LKTSEFSAIPVPADRRSEFPLHALCCALAKVEDQAASAGFRCASNVIAADPSTSCEIGFLSVHAYLGQTLQPLPVTVLVAGRRVVADHQTVDRAPNHFFLPVGC